MFSKDAILESTEGPLTLEKRRIFFGYLEDDEEAVVEAVVTRHGEFDGHIQTRDKLFYIEPANR